MLNPSTELIFLVESKKTDQLLQKVISNLLNCKYFSNDIYFGLGSNNIGTNKNYMSNKIRNSVVERRKIILRQRYENILK